MEFIDLIITIISSLIIGGWLTLRFNYNSLFAETVSKSRMKWINDFREEISTIIAMLDMECAACDKCKNIEDSCETSKKCQNQFDAHKATAKLRTRLNLDIDRYGNEYNKALDDILADLKFDGTDNALEVKETLITLSRKILEPEWQRVKQEAKGKGKR